MKKLKLRIDSLAVESFRPGGGGEESGQGTVHGRQNACTHWVSCPCDTGRYACATAPFTAYSCDYTIEAPC